jgi:hypothetical protein
MPLAVAGFRTVSGRAISQRSPRGIEHGPHDRGNDCWLTDVRLSDDRPPSTTPTRLSGASDLGILRTHSDHWASDQRV